MKTILCFGDSNTFGYDAVSRNRFPYDIRWTGVLQEKLGKEYRIIEEGLGGRTTVWEDPIEGYKSGKQYLIPCLQSHCPLDLIIIMLGTNDLKKRFSLSAYDIAEGAGVLVDMVLKSGCGIEGKAPKVLLVSPIHVGEEIRTSWLGEMFSYENSIHISKMFATYYRSKAEQYGCEFLDAAEIVKPDPVDAIHFDAEGHRRFAEALEAKIKQIL